MPKSPVRVLTVALDGGDLRSVRRARRAVSAALTEWKAPASVIDDAVLITSELVTNACVHTSSTRVAVTVTCAETGVVIAVADEGPSARPCPREPEWAEERGRGLPLVEALARCTTSYHPPGKSVIAELTRVGTA
jgi:anti-sigma regulatory factor (Ser/Thr protein kinase)